MIKTYITALYNTSHIHTNKQTLLTVLPPAEGRLRTASIPEWMDNKSLAYSQRAAGCRCRQLRSANVEDHHNYSAHKSSAALAVALYLVRPKSTTVQEKTCMPTTDRASCKITSTDNSSRPEQRGSRCHLYGPTIVTGLLGLLPLVCKWLLIL